MMNKEQIKELAEKFKGIFTEEELEKMEKDFEEWKKKTLEEQNKTQSEDC